MEIQLKHWTIVLKNVCYANQYLDDWSLNLFADQFERVYHFIILVDRYYRSITKKNHSHVFQVVQIWIETLWISVDRVK